MYKTIEDNGEFELIEKKSRFIANAIYVENKTEAENKIKEIKKKFYDAKHHCFAYRILDNESIYEKSSDDGEPSGTAGSPLLNILQKNNFCNMLIIVTRYFGGILLGTGGLVRAYSGAAAGAIENCSKINIEKGTEYSLIVDYTNFKKIQYYCKINKITINSIQYGENIICKATIPNSQKASFLLDIENKSIVIKEIKEEREIYIRKL